MEARIASKHQKDDDKYARMLPEVGPVSEMILGTTWAVLAAFWPFEPQLGPKEPPKCARMIPGRIERVRGEAKWSETAPKGIKK